MTLSSVKYATLAEQQEKERLRQIKWDNHWLGLAKYEAENSKDPSTKVGCVIIGRDNAVRSTGYNGLPRGADDEVPERNVRPEKLFWYEHAERNAIFNAARIGTALSGSTIYSTLCPCMDCARAIIQSGIKRVVTPKPDLEKYSLWAGQFERAETLYRECNVRLHYE